MASLPLEGIRVLDFGVAVAGPFCTRMLADMGAEVIKAESLTRLDIGRGLMFPDHKLPKRFWDDNGVYNTQNYNKLGLGINLTKPKGLELFAELVKKCDVVVTNFTTKVVRRFGLDYETLRKVKPDIILLTSSGFGHTGPWAEYASIGTSLEPMCGHPSLTGYVDGPPLQGPGAYPDMPGALNGAIAILAALEYRRRTGKGQWIDLAQYQTGVCTIGDAVLDYIANGRVQGRMGNRHPHMAPHGVYRCAGNNNWVAIAVANDEEWRALCNAMGQPALAEDERFRDSLSRLEHQDELDQIIEEWTKPQDHYAVMHLLQGVGVAAGAVLNMKEYMTDPQLCARNHFPAVRDISEEVGVRLCLGPWFQLSETPGGIRTTAPKLGQHNTEILTSILGLSPADVEQLQQDGVIGTEPLEVDQSLFAMAPLPVMKQLGAIEDFDADYKQILGIE